MQVARAAAPELLPELGRSDSQTRASNSYVPLYLTSTLRDIAFDLEELEGVSLDRLTVLKAAEAARTASASAAPATKLDGIRAAIRQAERSHGLNIPPASNPSRADRQLKDEASHFLLRLALCREHDHRNWLLATECDLFSTRLHGAGVDVALAAIRRANGPHVEPVSQNEIDRDPVLKKDLEAVQRGPNRARAGDPAPRYYKLAFEHVPNLVRSRRVLLRDGVAYVAERFVLDVVSAQFRMKLSAGLQTAARGVAVADADARMHPILQSIRDHFAASAAKDGVTDELRDTDRISLGELNEALPAMPLCMQYMMDRLRREHHLRHAARMQLGVFLKGCGLGMDESLRFWRDEFGKGDISAEKFEKTYAYNIRHHYGKEGKRRNLTPFACMRVINERPGPGEHHGCPFRELDEPRLVAALRVAGVERAAMPPIVARAKENNFQGACGACFAATQPGGHGVGEGGAPDYVPNHPNEYFIEARRRRVGPQDEAGGALDEELDDEEMIAAAVAAESQAAESQSQEKGQAHECSGRPADSVELSGATERAAAHTKVQANEAGSGADGDECGDEERGDEEREAKRAKVSGGDDGGGDDGGGDEGGRDDGRGGGGGSGGSKDEDVNGSEVGKN